MGERFINLLVKVLEHYDLTFGRLQTASHSILFGYGFQSLIDQVLPFRITIWTGVATGRVVLVAGVTGTDSIRSTERILRSRWRSFAFALVKATILKLSCVACVPLRSKETWFHPSYRRLSDHGTKMIPACFRRMKN